MNTNILSKVEKPYLKKVPELRAGDTVRVHQKIKEGNKERVQVFEGVVLRVKGSGIRSTFLVRKISFGVGVEKSFPLHSPNIAKIEIKKRAKVRQAYISYLRDLQGKSARLKEKGFDALAVNVVDEPEAEEVTDADVTELSEEQIAEVESEEVSIEEVEKAENKAAKAEDQKDEDSEGADHQVNEVEEIEAGVEKAEADGEKGKATEGEKAEKVSEEVAEEK
jgi:large subunit ribosomal protein L19